MVPEAKAEAAERAARAPRRQPCASYLPRRAPGPEAFVAPGGLGALNGERPLLRDPALARVWERLAAGKRPTVEDGLVCLSTWDLPGLAQVADRVKSRLWGDQVFFVFNRQINPTNLCVVGCKFCEYARRPGEAGAYSLGLDEILERLSVPGIREVHITGGLHPRWKFERYVEIVREIRRAYPAVQIKAYTAVEIDFFSRTSGLPVEAVLERLVAAGVDALPGGGAEVFSERVRAELFPRKIPAARWLEIHRTAHRMGIPSNCTLLYGHIETYRERVEHLLALRRLEDEAPGFLAFVPLAFQPGNTGIRTRPCSAIEDLRTVATARILLDNVPHIKAYWVMLGEGTASVALAFGASDIDGTIVEEKIAHAARAASPLGLARQRMVQMITEAGKIPVERDALYNRVRIYAARGEHAEGRAVPAARG